MALGGLGRDLMAALAAQGSLGAALDHPATGYAAVYALELLLLVLTLVVMRTLLARRDDADSPATGPEAPVEWARLSTPHVME